jgi:hypothetical protein
VGDRVGAGWHGGHDGEFGLNGPVILTRADSTASKAPVGLARRAFSTCVTTSPSTE